MKRSEWVSGLALVATATTLGVVGALSGGVLSLIVPWAAIHALLAMSLRLTMLVGEVNLATGAFYGIGAYTAAQCNLLAGTTMEVSVLLGTLTAAVAALAFGSVSLRASGAAFILVSFAFNEVLRLIYTKTDWLGGNSGLVGIFADAERTVVLLVVCTGTVALALVALERSRWGRRFTVTADKPLLASAVGINPRAVKVLAMTVSGAVAGLAGGFFAHYSSVIAPTDFSYMISISVLAFVMIGGRGSLVGAVLGAVLLTVLTEELKAFGAYEPLVYGGALMLAMVAMPQGIAGKAAAVHQRFRPRFGLGKAASAPAELPATREDRAEFFSVRGGR